MKKLAIGIDDYKEMIDKSYYFVDKTLLIKDLLDNQGKVNLFTRPRRFGKTLCLSMIQTYFEKEISREGKVSDNCLYFRGMQIMDAGEVYSRKMNQYPVITLSLKSAKQRTYEMAYESLIDEIAKEYDRHVYVLKGNSLSKDNKERYCAIKSKRAEEVDYAKSLAFLSECLAKYHKKKTIILIDEYDVPLENAYFRGFYEEMAVFIRTLFESALKSNLSLEFAVITGCLRITKESIFTGLNNLKVISILDDSYSEYFGFTDPEVRRMLDYYGICQCFMEVKKWYDGYQFGASEVYNPWSVVNYVFDAVNALRVGNCIVPKPYWSNTSSNSIVRELIESADILTKHEIEGLMSGGTIEKAVHEDITYEDIYNSQDNLWNFLFFTGYLRKISERQEERMRYITFAVPNEEVAYIYENFIMEWFDQRLKTINLTLLYEAVLEGDCETFGLQVTNQLIDTISVFDYAENYYHGFLAGLLKGCPGYVLLSNRESGSGRPDLILKSPSVRGKAFILELKVVNSLEKMEAGCDKALAQIEEKKYSAELQREGYKNIEWYGVCFYRKECIVKHLKSKD